MRRDDHAHRHLPSAVPQRHDLRSCAELAPYLARLGISHLYAAPIFEAEPGSTHGYDVVDNRVIDSSLGGDEAFQRMAAAFRAEGMGIVLDFVPNHMSASTYNPYWRDVLEWGEASDCAQFFDIDWSAPKLLVPALGSSYGAALGEGRFGLHFDARDGGMTFTYYGLKLPLTPTSYAQVLMRADGEDFAEWARRFAVATPQTSAELKAELAEAARDPATHRAIEQAMAAVAADADALHELHEMQIWRLTHWRAARETLTYRRFFEITDLVGMQEERPARPRRDACAAVRSGRSGQDRRHPARSHRWSRRSQSLSGAAAEDRRRGRPVLSRGREDLGAGGGAARRLAGRRHHRLRVHPRAR
ncbi:alpha-amylase family glycosyl hydrolase [Methyloceanibacter superfactus]|uniref:alpha-amylase family glycosyl hydrolase n=1 Tax=Methyloceanibacter superfactus TaxID=1774969 RepID=UPI001FCD9073|nr:alpha-amylase family glycosyl hydrolase [Methyloceanibacter superfactus]